MWWHVFIAKTTTICGVRKNLLIPILSHSFFQENRQTRAGTGFQVKFLVEKSETYHFVGARFKLSSNKIKYLRRQLSNSGGPEVVTLINMPPLYNGNMPIKIKL